MSLTVRSGSERDAGLAAHDPKPDSPGFISKDSASPPEGRSLEAGHAQAAQLVRSLHSLLCYPQPIRMAMQLTQSQGHLQRTTPGDQRKYISSWGLFLSAMKPCPGASLGVSSCSLVRTTSHAQPGINLDQSQLTWGWGWSMCSLKNITPQ